MTHLPPPPQTATRRRLPGEELTMRSAMTKSRITTGTAVRVGDRITEVDTPEGPFYTVLKVNAKSIVVDANGLRGDTDETAPPVPIRLPTSARHVLRVAV